MTAIFNFLMIAGAIQGFIFNVATFLSRKKIEKPVLFLNLLVLFLSLNNLQSWFIEKRFIPSEFQLHDFTIPWYVLIVPMFYAFLIHYLGIEGKRHSFIKVSIGIFCAELAVRTAVIFLVNKGVWSPEFLDIYNNVEDVITLFYSLFLFYKAIQIVFKKESPETPISDFDDLRWLKWFFYLGGGVFVLWIQLKSKALRNIKKDNYLSNSFSRSSFSVYSPFSGKSVLNFFTSAADILFPFLAYAFCKN